MLRDWPINDDPRNDSIELDGTGRCDRGWAVDVRKCVEVFVVVNSFKTADNITEYTFPVAKVEAAIRSSPEYYPKKVAIFPSKANNYKENQSTDRMNWFLFPVTQFQYIDHNLLFLRFNHVKYPPTKIKPTHKTNWFSTQRLPDWSRSEITYRFRMTNNSRSKHKSSKHWALILHLS